MERSCLAIAGRSARAEGAAVRAAGRAEFSLVLGCALLVVLLSALPYVVAYLTAPAGSQYLGLLSNPSDGNSYLSKMQEGARGEWLFHLPYTTEPHDGVFLFSFYLALGHLAAVVGLPLVLVYHAARLVAGLVLLLVGYAFIASLMDGTRRRMLVWSFFALGSGLGWLAAPLGYYSADLLIPEATSFHAIFANPHFPLSTALLIGVFLLLLRASRTRRLVWGVGAAALSVPLTLLQPFLMLTVYAVSAGWLALLYRSRRRPPYRETLLTGLVLLASLPAVAVSYMALYGDPVLAQWTAQNQAPSPSPLAYVLGYGLLSPLALLGLVAMVRKWKGWELRAGGGEMAVAWLVMNVVLLYVPFALQRRFAEGLQMPVAIFAALGVGAVVSWDRGRPRLRRPLRASSPAVPGWVFAFGGFTRVALARAGRRCSQEGGAARRGTRLGTVLILLTLPTNLFVMGVSMVGVHEARSGFYLSADEMDALKWLSRSTAPEEGVLSSPEIGNLIPAWAGNRVYYGHPFETVQAESKRAALQSLFGGGMASEAREELVQGAGVRYLYYGEQERRMGSFDPTVEPYLEPAFSNTSVHIYRVAP